MMIVHIVPTYVPYASGGSAYSLFRLNTGLPSYKKITISLGLKKNGVMKNHIVHSENHESFFFSKYSLKMFKAVFNVCRKADLIQLSSFFFPPNLLVFIIAKLYSKDLIISPRGEFFDYALKRKKRQKILYLRLFNFISPNATFHATSEKEAMVIRKWIRFVNEENIINIFNSFDTKNPISENRRNQFLFLGRINPIKNIHSVFKAIKNIENITFLIAGEANLPYEKEYLNFLRNKIGQLGIEKKVRFLGKLHDVEKYKVIASCKCLVLPSHSENFGNVVLESLSQGTPVIASLGTPWELLEDYKCGHHIDFNQTENLKELLSEYLGYEKKDFKKYQENSKKLMKKFHTKVINERWISLYESKRSYKLM